METKKNFNNTLFTFAFIYAILGIVFMLIKSPLADPKSTSTMIFGFVSLFSFIAVPVLAVWYFKNKGEVVTLGKSVKLGVLVGLLGGLLVGIYAFIYFKFINPDIIDQIIEMSNQMLEESGILSEEQIAKQTETSQSIFAPMQLVGNIFTGLLYGVIGGLLGGLFFKTPQREEY